VEIDESDEREDSWQPPVEPEAREER